MLKEDFLHYLVKCFYNSRFRFKYSYDSFDPLRKDPYILIGNHVSLNDGLYTAVPLKRYPYPVVNAFMYSSPFMRFILKRVIRSIPKRKGQNDTTTIRNMMDTIKKDLRGVMLYPEGNASFFGSESPIPYSTAKFLKKVKLDVVICHVNGGYLAAPRWGKSIRGGYFEVKFKTLYTSEALESVSTEELDQAIVEALRFNDFDWNREHHHIYKSKNRSVGLERYIYACPHCGEVQCLTTKGSKVYCRYCGEIAHFNDYSLLEDVPFDNLVDWDIYQKTRLPFVAEKTFKSQGYLHQVTMENMSTRKFGSHQIELKDGILTCMGKKHTLIMPIKDIVNLVLIKKNNLMFDYLDMTYYIRIQDPMLFLDVINYLKKGE